MDYRQISSVYNQLKTTCLVCPLPSNGPVHPVIHNSLVSASRPGFSRLPRQLRPQPVPATVWLTPGPDPIPDHTLGLSRLTQFPAAISPARPRPRILVPSPSRHHLTPGPDPSARIPESLVRARSWPQGGQGRQLLPPRGLGCRGPNSSWPVTHYVPAWVLGAGRDWARTRR